ncbi:MAG: sigma-70 family RNA polymerase sigma factor [Bacilli bacterium]|nr:sigma-70 family RNA polymerase sigma factor [Bacilli bacterium]MDD4808795.1 sigma-70 family RNA polymerase sigma factor [Bacilli bacterium]
MDKEFIEIFNLYKNDIYRLAFSYTRNFADSDDITQNVFVKLYNKFDSFSDKDYMKKWLIRVAVNECKTLFLSAWKRKILPFTGKEENIFYQENKNDDLLEEVFELPKKYRIVVYLYYYENYKVKEISEILNITETTIQTQLFRAREKLKEILKEDFNCE